MELFVAKRTATPAAWRNVDELRRAGDRLGAAVDDPVEVEDHQSHPLGKAAHGAR